MTRRSNIHWQSHIIRYTAGLIIAAVAYYAASISSIQDCSMLRLTVHSGGLITLGRIFFGLVVCIMIGMPAPVAAIFAGLLTSPFTGSALTAFAFITALAVWFLIGRFMGRDNSLVQSFERWASGRLWFTDLMAARAHSGFHWVAEYVYRTPIPPILFAAFCGASVKRLGIVELLTGAFISFIAMIIAFSLAGGNIGCALLDHVHGLPTKEHVIPIVISVVALVAVSKLRSRMSL
jgi:hypothetical protein